MQIVTKHLLCVWHYAMRWECNGEQKQSQELPLRSLQSGEGERQIKRVFSEEGTSSSRREGTDPDKGRGQRIERYKEEHI